MSKTVGKTHNSGHIHLNTDMTEEDTYNKMIRIIMKQYTLNTELKNSRNDVKHQSHKNYGICTT